VHRGMLSPSIEPNEPKLALDARSIETKRAARAARERHPERFAQRAGCATAPMEVVAALQPDPAPPVRTVITAAPPSASRAAPTGTLALDLAPEHVRSVEARARPGPRVPRGLEARRGRCQWKLANGDICGCTRHLQLDHVKPLALGGNSTVQNLRILCSAHDFEAARLVFGDAWMDRYTRRATRQRGPEPSADRGGARFDGRG
jgi:hypothetical protein